MHVHENKRYGKKNLMKFERQDNSIVYFRLFCHLSSGCSIF